jgi:hypothetical protein
MQPISNHLFAKCNRSQITLLQHATDLKSPFSKMQPISNHPFAKRNRSQITRLQTTPNLPSPFPKHMDRRTGAEDSETAL